MKFQRSIQTGKDGRKYRLYVTKQGGMYIMLAGNVGEQLDWGVYVNTSPVLECNDYYVTGLSFKQAVNQAHTYAVVVQSKYKA